MNRFWSTDLSVFCRGSILSCRWSQFLPSRRYAETHVQLFHMRRCTHALCGSWCSSQLHVQCTSECRVRGQGWLSVETFKAGMGTHEAFTPDESVLLRSTSASGATSVEWRARLQGISEVPMPRWLHDHLAARRETTASKSAGSMAWTHGMNPWHGPCACLTRASCRGPHVSSSRRWIASLTRAFTRTEHCVHRDTPLTLGTDRLIKVWLEPMPVLTAHRLRPSRTQAFTPELLLPDETLGAPNVRVDSPAHGSGVGVSVAMAKAPKSTNR